MKRRFRRLARRSPCGWTGAARLSTASRTSRRSSASAGGRGSGPWSRTKRLPSSLPGRAHRSHRGRSWRLWTAPPYTPRRTSLSRSPDSTARPCCGSRRSGRSRLCRAGGTTGGRRCSMCRRSERTALHPSHYRLLRQGGGPARALIRPPSSTHSWRIARGERSSTCIPCGSGASRRRSPRDTSRCRRGYLRKLVGRQHNAVEYAKERYHEYQHVHGH